MHNDNVALTRRWFEEVWNQRRAEVIDELMALDCVAHGMSGDGGDLRGTAAFKEAHRMFLGAFPDLHVNVEDVIVEGDRGAVRLHCTGTHSGDHLGVPASGSPVSFAVMGWARWRDGKIVEGWNVIDFHTMNRQIGGG